MHTASTSLHGYYRSSSGKDSLSALYASPLSSSVTVHALLLPTGGLSTANGLGGLGKLPSQTYSQGGRSATSHAVLVQTPHVYTSMNQVAVLVQLYDAHGNSDVSSAPLSVTVSLEGVASPLSLSLTRFSWRGVGAIAQP